MKINAIVGAISLAVLGLSPAPAVSSTAKFVNWLKIGASDNESGYSALEQINTATVGRLGLAWYLDLPGEQTLEATPLAVDGLLYFTGSYSKLYAVDAVSGKLRWSHDPEIWAHNPHKMRTIFAVNRGAAYDHGRVFYGTLDGRLLALDAKTGQLLWSADTVTATSVNTITGAPRVFNGKVLIGNGGADWNGRGYVTAYDQATGKQVWRFYTVPGAPEENAGDPAMMRAAETWRGEYWKTGTGGTVWNGMTFDPELNRVYIGTGNGGPYNPEVRSPGGGDNLYLASIVALDADTGKYVWHYQMNPREAWDYKATANMIATTLTLDGKLRKVLMQAPTNGFFYVLDRETGKVISAEKIGKVNWAERIDIATGRPVEAPNIRYEQGETVIFPAGYGAHNWQPMTYSPVTGLVYIPYMQLGMRFSTKAGGAGKGAAEFGGLSIKAVAEDPEDGKGALLAWDPVTQRARWKVQHQTMWNGGTLVTGGGLVFQGLADGTFGAYDAATGRKVWEFDAGLGIVGAPITFAVDGRQYVSVLVGTGGSIASINDKSLGTVFNEGWKFGAQPRRLLTFAIGGKAKLPPTAPRNLAVKPVDDPTFVIKDSQVKEGNRLYANNCAMCHGLNLLSVGSPAPDLRESRLALNRETFRLVVQQGMLIRQGMPRFDQLTDDEIDAIMAYIRAGARAAAKKSS